jgi:deoxyribose-phosphate aldolase
MKTIEYASYDYAINETEALSNVSKAISLGANVISILPYSINTVKNIPEIESGKVKLSCAVDIPYGLSDSKSRIFMCSQIIKSRHDINFLDIMIPTKIITNRKYDKFREEIKNLIETSFSHNIKIRYILEYRTFSHEVIAKVCSILQEFGLDTIFPSSGMMLDNIEDNLIACNFLSTKTNIKTICTGNVYQEKHIQNVKNMTNLEGIRFFYLNGLEMLSKISI